MLLDFRLNYLNKYVDNFVIVESAFTHSGQKRELLFDIEKFKKYKDKICYIAIEQEPDNLQKIYEDDDKDKIYIFRENVVFSLYFAINKFRIVITGVLISKT